MRPGPETGFDYITLPYNPKWEPVDNRRWAEQFVDEDGREDFEGFRKEFRTRHPFLMHNHGDSYLPASVSHYLRHDQQGSRRDIDLELALTPLTEEEIAEREAAKKADIRKRRRAVLDARGLDEVGKPKTRAKAVATEVASRME